jgi:hypothetical protein
MGRSGERPTWYVWRRKGEKWKLYECAVWLRIVATGSLEEDEVLVAVAIVVFFLGGWAWAEAPGMRNEA